MQTGTSLSPRAQLASRRVNTGFTLIEVMVTVAIIAILSAIALPAYTDYIMRGRLVDATNLLSTGRANMERYFQDNRTYASVTVGTVTSNPPCANAIPVAQRTQGAFVLTCTTPNAPDASTYTLTATGSGQVSAFSYTIDQADNRKSTIGAAAPSGWATSGELACWRLKKGQTC